MGRHAVAAGDGAFSTCTVCGASRIRKSSTSVPSLSTAWARTPAGDGRRSSSVTAGSSRWTARVNADRDSERCTSPAPYRQWRRAMLQVPGQLSVDSSSAGRTRGQVYPSRARAGTAFGPTWTEPSNPRVRWTPRNGNAGSGTG